MTVMPRKSGRDLNVSDTALREWIMNEAWGHHASCSCKLGATDDGTAVLG